MKARQAVSRILLIAIVVSIPLATAAGTLPADVVAMFPKDVGEVAYADLRAARKLSWFPQLKEQMLPARFRQFEQFLASAGIDPNSQVHEVAWALVAPTAETGEQVVGIALGQFSPKSAEDFFRAQKLPTSEVHGYKLFAFGSGVGPNDILFFFLDSNTAAFGHRALLERLIDVRFGAEEGLLRNDKMFGLVNEVNGRGLVWAVLNDTYTRIAMRQLVPEAAQFAPAEKVAAKIQHMTISVQADSRLEADFSAVCANPEDANLLAAMLQGGLVYRRYQAQQTNPELVQVLDAIRVNPRGERLELEIGLTEETLIALLKRNTFATRM